MAYSSLKRNAPLQGKGVFLRRVPLNGRRVGQQPAGDGGKAVAGAKTRHRAKKTCKVDLSKRLDMVFSAYIRLRDAMPGGQTRCISCGRVLPFTQMQAGHFFSRRSMSTRWDERNVHSQCVECNCHEHGNLARYEESLRRKIGDAEFLRLCDLRNQVRKWSDAELKDAIAHYTAEVRRLSKEKGVTVRI